MDLVSRFWDVEQMQNALACFVTVTLGTSPSQALTLTVKENLVCKSSV